MSVKVIWCRGTVTPPYAHSKKTGVAKFWANFKFETILEIRGERKHVDFEFQHDYTWDGASVPWAFQWFLPDWSDDSSLYNLGSGVHDWLYGNKGAGLFTREECDDIFRGIIRESGVCRFRAGVADKCLELFAGGKKHWGNDAFGCKDKCSVKVY